MLYRRTVPFDEKSHFMDAREVVSRRWTNILMLTANDAGSDLRRKSESIHKFTRYSPN